MVLITDYTLAVSAATLIAMPASCAMYRLLFPPQPVVPPSRDAQHLLERLASLASDPVPDFLFDVPMSGLSFPDARPALQELVACELVMRDPHTSMYSIPQAVRDATPWRRPAEALHWIDAAFQGDPHDPRDQRYLELLAPHAAAVIAYAEEEGLPSPTVDLMKRLGVLLRANGQSAEATALFQRAIAIADANFGTHDSEVEETLHELAEAASPPAEPLKLRRRVFGRNVQRLVATTNA
jgi:hypothetical protein